MMRIITISHTSLAIVFGVPFAVLLALNGASTSAGELIVTVHGPCAPCCHAPPSAGAEVVAGANRIQTGDRQPQTREIPEFIWRSGPAITAAWKDVHHRLADPSGDGVDDPKLYIRRGRILSAVHRPKLAEADFRRAARIIVSTADDDVQAVRNLDRLRELFASVRPLPALPPASTVAGSRTGRRAYGRGFHAFWDGRLTESLSHFDWAIELHRFEPLYWYYRALALRRMGRHDEAAESARMGAFWERQTDAARNKSESRSRSWAYIGTQLQRIQGTERQWLERARIAISFSQPSVSR